MNKEQIDKLFEAFKNEDYDTIFAMADLEMTLAEFESKSEEEQERIYYYMFERFMGQIEKGDYDYFKSLIQSKDESKQMFVSSLLRFSSKKQDIINLIENRHQFGLDNNTVRDLLVATGDTKYIADVLRNDKLDLKLDKYDIYNLLIDVRRFSTNKRCC